MTSLPSLIAVPRILNRQQLDAVIENIVQLRTERAELESAMDNEIAAIREKYRAPLAELERYLLQEIAWVETWAQENPDEFTAGALECPQATIGFRSLSPRVERASRKWTWTAAALKLAESAWGRRYLRIPAPEVNKEAILADLGARSADEWRQVGIKILQGNRFYIEPHGQMAEVETTDPDLQEAA